MARSAAPNTTPPSPPSGSVGGFEALAVRGMTWWNTSSLAKRLVYGFVRYVSHTWIQAVISNRLQITGAEHVRGLQPERGVLLIGNHRTFWDMYVATSALTVEANFARRYYFPVRSRFFYTNPLGVLVNFAVSGGSMWPPISTGFDRTGRNAAALEELARVLDAPTTLAGIHPEGTRSKGADPLDLLPAKGGAGRVLQGCHPDVLVIPYFLTGLTNNFPREVLRNYRRPGNRGPAVRLVWGEPFRAGDVDRTVAPVVVARELLEGVRALGASLEPPPSDPPMV